MRISGQLLKMAEDNNGIVTSSMADEANIPRALLNYLCRKRKLEKASRGVYVLPDAWDDDFVSLQTRYKRGIYSLDTALFLHDLTDRTPARFHMTFPSAYNLTNPKADGIICNTSNAHLYDIGIIEVKTPAGNTVRAYNAERTLCEIVRRRNHTDIQVIAEALNRYVSEDTRDIRLLSEYAKTFKVEERIRTYLEVLL